MEAGEHGLAVRDRSRHNHPVRFDAFQLARLQICDDDHLAVEELLGRVGLGDAGHDGARLGFADINSLVKSLKVDLADDGILIINIPMSTGFFYRMATLQHKLGLNSNMTRMWQFNFHSPHMNYFNESNMKMLLEKHGLLCKHVLKLDTLDFASVKERILADKRVNRLTAAVMTTTLTLMKPVILNSEPDIKAFFFKKK